MSTQTQEAVPPSSPVSPHLVVRDARAAIAFYAAAFGAEELLCQAAPDGRVMHATLRVNGGTVFVCDDFPEYMGGRASTPEALGGSPVTIHLQVADADAVFATAVATGATVTMPLVDQFWGDRYGRLRDPFGHSWSIATTRHRLSKEELAQATQAAFQASPGA